jgi:AraC-like DNA-binding protein
MPNNPPDATGRKSAGGIWPGLRCWDIFEGPKRILPEVPFVGEFNLKNVVPDALKADRHIGQFEVHLIYDGIRELWIDVPENILSIRSGYGIILQPGQWHGGARNAQYRAWYNSIRFQIPCGRAAALPGMSPRQTAEIRRTIAGVETPIFNFSSVLGDSLRKLIDEHRNRDIGMQVATRGAFLEFLAWLQRDLLRSQNAVDRRGGIPALSPEIQNSLDYLEKNIGISLSVKNMAEAAGLSTSRFRRLFHKQMGLSPHDYLARRRVELSKIILRTDKKSVTDVAMDLGFASAAHFALVFRRYVGVAPSQWRNQGKVEN